MTPNQKEVYDHKERGMSYNDIAKLLGISAEAVRSRYRKAKKWLKLDPEIQARLKDKGYTDIGGLHSGWIIDKDKNGAGESLYFYLGKDGDDAVKFTDMVTESLDAYQPLNRKLFAPRINAGAKGEHLLVVDSADVHFGKLCEVEETNHDYTTEVARHRMIEGTKGLLEKAKSFGISRIMYIAGNDILHTENGKTTTSGTPQDHDGSWFKAYKAAQHASIDAISECAAVADVDLIHCMSNHDWRTGWALSQTIAATFGNHNGVRATDYNLSQRHRKFYGFENNGFLITHGDGTKEEKLYGHFVQEAKEIVANCNNLYALLHHFHHKIAKRRGVDVFQSEKDHNGMTAIISGAPRPEGVHVGIEYVRSPSAPDGWHDRNGYLNRQGVEAFLYHPHDGQTARFTEWF